MDKPLIKNELNAKLLQHARYGNRPFMTVAWQYIFFKGQLNKYGNKYGSTGDFVNRENIGLN